MLHILLEEQIIETEVVGYQISDVRYALLKVAGSSGDWKIAQQSLSF
jgi:hypothetical protein